MGQAVRLLASTSLYSLERIDGRAGGAPFAAFLLRLPRRRVRLSLSASKPRKLTRHLEETKAFAGLNGGFFTPEGQPLDWLVADGKVLSPLANPKRPCLYLENGEARIGPPPASGAPPPRGSVLQAGPLLLRDGEVQTDYSDFIEKAADFDSDITAGRHPRSVFGLSEEHACFLAVLGRSFESRGLYLDETAELARAAGLRDALNLDGGASSTLIVEGRRLTCPKLGLSASFWFLCPPYPGGEKAVPNAVLAQPRD